MCVHAQGPFIIGGFLGVDIFFVLSGFLITALLLKEYDDTGSIHFKNFYIRRLLRLLPALIIVLIVLNLLSIVLLNASETQTNLIDSFFALFYVYNWAVILHIRDLFFLTHTWSLSIEEQFYIFWPFVLLLLLRLQPSREKIFGIILGVAMLSWLWRIILTITTMSVSRVFYSTDTRLDSLLLGCALVFLINLRPPRLIELANRFSFIPVLAFIGLLYLGITTDGNVTSAAYWALPATALLTTVIVFYFVVGQSSLLKRFFEMRWLVFIGRISYGLYLWHYIIFKYLSDYMHLSWLETLLIGSVISLAVSLVSYHFIELPILRLKSRFKVPDQPVMEPAASQLRKMESG